MPNSHYDLVVIGSGPAGSTTARFAAMQGLKVLLVDIRQKLGAPIQYSGAVSRHGIDFTVLSGAYSLTIFNRITSAAVCFFWNISFLR